MRRTISIIICTRNKAESLRETLRAISGVDVPADLSAEVIVADNGSTDQTPAVVGEFAASQQKFSVRHVSVPTPGQSRARNAGISATSGEIILFTDDDVRPPQNWIEGMCRPILEGRADATTQSAEIPSHLYRRWMGYMHKGYLACLPWPKAGPLPPGSQAPGLNLCFSRAVLAKVPRFDEALGPGAMGFADDGLFTLQLQQAGFRLEAVAGAAPAHHFDVDRLSRAVFLRDAARRGCCEGYIRYHWLHEEITFPRTRLAKHQIQLAVVRLFRGGSWVYSEGAPEWELRLLEEVHLYKQYLRERRRPRRYAERFGLSVSSSCGADTEPRERLGEINKAK